MKKQKKVENENQQVIDKLNLINYLSNYVIFLQVI